MLMAQLDIFSLLNAVVSNLNIPSFAVILLALIIYMVQMTNRRQDRSDIRYDKLVEKFIETTKTITENHDKSLKSLKDGHEQLYEQLIKELGDMKNELKVCGIRMEETNRLFIFDRNRK